MTQGWMITYRAKNGTRDRAYLYDVTLDEAERIIADAGGTDVTITALPTFD